MIHKLFIALLLTTSLFAGNNSQATLGDMKEAIYKLIVQNKNKRETPSDITLKKSKYDGFISNFIKNNTKLIASIEK